MGRVLHMNHVISKASNNKIISMRTKSFPQTAPTDDVWNHLLRLALSFFLDYLQNKRSLTPVWCRPKTLRRSSQSICGGGERREECRW